MRTLLILCYLIMLSLSMSAKISKNLVDTTFVVKATKYNPVKSQCYGNPLITADNSRINLEKLRKMEIKWIAVSRDLLNYYSYGDTLIIESENPNLSGEWVIHDTMAKRWIKRIDYLTPVNDKLGFYSPVFVKIRKKMN